MASEGRPVALVTGASSGIGEATALALAGAGYAVALTARRAELLEALAARIRRGGGAALPVPIDLRAGEQIDGMVRAVEAQLGPVAVLINNAGVSLRHRAWRPSDEVIDGVLGTNLLAPIRVVRAVAPLMVERRRGHIINIGSMAAHIGAPGTALYSASKAGLRMWSKTLGRELRRHGLRVSLISPGYIRTPMTSSVPWPMPPPKVVAAAALGLLRRPRREVVVPRYYAVAAWLEWFAPWAVDLAAVPLARRAR
jgi:NAD(P)-dependent dehydrogenase (short-subunit alcohol dehydrogenase family)